ncbi:unnamed protein product [Hyaloperonospora brassicae]|uniref:RxLR effector candidate protein n=1 Tax=Hyaloperonospora brassicae TaxID=162125 RepID=A0AAV0T6D9_HYABA|nr:unnamed protein product [Hyaloperonospora brassicae]
MRSICLIALFMDSVTLVLADYASGLIEAPVPERASTNGDILAKITELAIGKASESAPLIESTPAKFVGWKGDAGANAREHQGELAGIADADGHQIISTAYRPGNVEDHFETCVHQLHSNQDHKELLEYLRSSLIRGNDLVKLQELVKEGSVFKAAKAIHTQRKSPHSVEWDNLKTAEFLQWIMEKKNPVDVQNLLVKSGGEGTEAIALEIAISYENYVRAIGITYDRSG